MRLCFLFLLLPHLLFSDPWGKDADLTGKRPNYQTKYGLAYPTQEYCPPRRITPFLSGFAEVSIWFHQNVISPADGPRSHYFPSSSQYTLEAIRKYGFFKGVMFGCDRLMRENDDLWVYREYVLPDCTTLKYDPVP